MIRTLEDAREFAVRWVEAWNRRDVEAVLLEFDDDVVFTSPTALVVTGAGTVRGKGALRAYWTAALERVRSLRFTVDRVLWDSERREIAIIYTSDTDGTRKRVSENLTIDGNGRVVSAEVFHGVTGQR